VEESMHRRLRAAIAAAATVVLSGVAGAMITSGPAPAAPPPGCNGGYVCFYVDINFNHRDPTPNPDNYFPIPVSFLYECEPVVLGRDGVWTSFYNNTRFSFELWNRRGPGSVRRAGTMAPFKGYGYLNATFNDRVESVRSPGCGWSECPECLRGAEAEVWSRHGPMRRADDASG
jgi:hypothetical protein